MLSSYISSYPIVSPEPIAANVVDLTFASVFPRVGDANVKSKTTLESSVFWCPFGSDIRK
jgi:hypothetical protein